MKEVKFKKINSGDKILIKKGKFFKKEKKAKITLIYTYPLKVKFLFESSGWK